jgi:hypothetical protein
MRPLNPTTLSLEAAEFSELDLLLAVVRFFPLEGAFLEVLAPDDFTDFWPLKGAFLEVLALDDFTDLET